MEKFMNRVLILTAIFFLSVVILSCGDDDGGDDWNYHPDKMCNGFEVDYYVFCAESDAYYKPCDDVGDFDGGQLHCSDDCKEWDTSECSKCGDGDKTGDEVCDGDVKTCAFAAGGDYFKTGTAYCNSTCNGWDMKECVYNLCPDGGIPSDSWQNLAGNRVCLCSPFCETDEDCKNDGEICSPVIGEYYGNYFIKSCVKYDEESGDGSPSVDYYSCVEE